MLVRIESLDHKLIQCLAGYVAFSKGLNPVLLTVVNNISNCNPNYGYFDKLYSRLYTGIYFRGYTVAATVQSAVNFIVFTAPKSQIYTRLQINYTWLQLLKFQTLPSTR